MTYETLILSIFKKLGFEPREHQLSAIDRILVSFGTGKKNVVLSAPTGSGKSVIGLVVSECLRELEPKVDELGESLKVKLAAYYLTGTIALTQQYERSFSDKFGFLEVKSAVNYPCLLMDKGIFDPPDGEQKSAEHCTRSVLVKKKGTPAECSSSLCSYHYMKTNLHEMEHVAMNYSYFFSSSRGHRLAPRLVTVWDEAHLFNDILCAVQTIEITLKKLDRLKDVFARFNLKTEPISQLKKTLNAEGLNED